MTTRILVISDLHLGGGKGFQMCSAQGRERLACFIDWATAQKAEVQDLRLVLNGDVKAKTKVLKGGAADTVRACKEQLPDGRVTIIHPLE